MGKKVLAVLLCTATLLGLGLPFAGLVGFAAEDPVQVEFWNDLPGSAAATVTFNAKNGKYDLYWTDAAGEKLTVTVGEKTLSYSSLGKLSVSGGSGKLTLQPFTAIPAGAAGLAVLDSHGEAVGRYTLPEEKKQASAPRYAYGVISDVHFNYKDYGKAEDAAAVALRRALQFYTDTGCSLVSVTGDIGVYGEKSSYTGFRAVADEFDLTVLECGGNHEVNGSREEVYSKKGYWRSYMNKGVYDGSLEGVLEIAKNGIDFVYQIPGQEEIFIYLHQMHWDGRAANGGKLLDPEQIEWLSAVLERYKDRRVMLQFHTYLSDDDREHADGEGDLKNAVGTGYNYAYNPNAVEEEAFRALLTEYRNVTWYNGHSHFTYAMQQYNENLNIFDYYGSTATMIHVPSVTAPRTVTDTGTGLDVQLGKQSEGVLVFVCDGYQVVTGVDFMKDEMDAYACYICYDGTEQLVDGSSGALTYTYHRQLASLRIDGEGSLDGAVASFAAVDPGRIRRLYVASGVQKLSDGARKGMTALETLEIKEGCLSIGEECFADAAALTKISLPGSLQEIGKNAFAGLGKTVQFVFNGTSAEYAALQVADGNEGLTKKVSSFGSYLITWIIGDQTVLSKVKAGKTPLCPVTPVQSHEDPKKAWLFTGWRSAKGKEYKASANLPAADTDGSYTAVFGQEVDRYASGDLDKRVHWTLDRMNGTLTFSGKGAMPDCSKQTGYGDYKNEIRTVIVQQGLTSLGKGVLARLPKLQTVVIESGVKSLDMDCMAYCSALQEIWLPEKIMSVKQGVLFNSDAIECIHYAGNAAAWETVIKHTAKTYNDNLVGAGNLDYGKAAPTDAHYTVSFYDADGSLLSTAEQIGWNQPATFTGTLTPPDGMRFLYWDTPFTAVREDLKVTAVYAPVAPTEDPTDPPAEGDSSATEPEPPSQGTSRPILWVVLGVGGGIAVAAVVTGMLLRKKKTRK